MDENCSHHYYIYIYHIYIIYHISYILCLAHQAIGARTLDPLPSSERSSSVLDYHWTYRFHHSLTHFTHHADTHILISLHSVSLQFIYLGKINAESIKYLVPIHKYFHTCCCHPKPFPGTFPHIQFMGCTPCYMYCLYMAIHTEQGVSLEVPLFSQGRAYST